MSLHVISVALIENWMSLTKKAPKEMLNDNSAGLRK